MRSVVRIVMWLGLAFAVTPGTVGAHCDALDGPVVTAAREALAAGDVALVLPWVSADREAEITEAFGRASQVRGLRADAQALADTWFFETVVRIHRAGEGASFDGLKPAGHIDPLVAMADGTLATGAVDSLLAKVTAHVAQSVRERFDRAREAKAHVGEGVEAGRRFVEAYVDYVHHLEALHKAALGATAAHAAGTSAAHPH